MSLIKWKKEYDTNLVEINHQHLEMMHILNELNIKFINGYNNRELVIILNKLSNYALTHFTTEERFFAKYDYPEMDSHMDEHRYFLKKIEFFKEDLLNSKNDFFDDMLNFLTAWLNDHILNVDKKYIAYFKEIKANLTTEEEEAK